MDALQQFYTELAAVSEIGKTATGWNRLAFTDAERAAVEYFLDCCRQSGLTTRTDVFGNAYARWEGEYPDAPVVLCGSHLDTVTDGGPLDGAVGVFAALAAVRRLKAAGHIPHHPVEIVAFACEESSCFGFATLGSKIIAGMVGREKLDQLQDRDGVTLREAMERWGYSYENLPALVRGDLKAYLELHIEQGPTLEATGDRIGIVTAIAAPTRLKINLQGVASHSGATAMSYRRDALTGAAEFILAAEANGRKEEAYGTVVTVGVCDVLPGVMNVVPGEARLQVDVRSIDSGSKKRVVDALYKDLHEICQNRGLQSSAAVISDDEPVHMNGELNRMLAEVCRESGLSCREMPSGAGHDAMNVRQLCPAALIFVPSQNGISHNPSEYTHPEDLARGVAVLAGMLERLTGAS